MMHLVELIGAANIAVTYDSSKISAFVLQEHYIRMCSDERNNLSQEFLSGCPCTSRLLIFFLKI